MPVTDVKGFVDYAKSRDKPLFYATLGPGSVTHLFGIMMSKSMGFAVTDVPYRNNPLSIMDLLSGACDLNFATPAAVMEHATAGTLRILALSSDKRSPNLPDVPTLAESGYPELTASFWTALHAPAGTPPDVIARLNAAANAAMQKPEIANSAADRRIAGGHRRAGPARCAAQKGCGVVGAGDQVPEHRARLTALPVPATLSVACGAPAWAEAALAERCHRPANR